MNDYVGGSPIKYPLDVSVKGFKVFYMCFQSWINSAFRAVMSVTQIFSSEIQKMKIETNSFFMICEEPSLLYCADIVICVL